MFDFRRSDQERRVQLLIAIPIYNELKYVTAVLDKVKRFHNEILLVDDGSSDGTSPLLRARTDIHLLSHPTNAGYGQSLIDAFAYADERGFDWVITMDCDEQHEPEMIPRFIEEIRTDRWDLISGSRYLHPRRDDDLPPGDRRRINATLTQMLNERLKLKITDAFCGYKAHRMSAMRRLTLDVPGYAFPMQLWPQAAAAGLRIEEIPVRLIYNDPTRHFGGQLDDAANRLRHYVQTFEDEMARIASLRGPQQYPPPVEPVSCCCGD